MNAKIALFCVAVLFAISIQSGEAKLKCYQCTATSSSQRDPCYDPRSSGDIKPRTCSEDIVSKFIDLLKVAVSTEQLKPVCMKTEIKVGKETIIRRDCAMVPVSNMKFQDKCQQMSVDTNGVLEYCGVCEQDGCNPASTVHLVNVIPLLFSVPLLLRLA